MKNKRTIFLTGITGTLGKEMLREILLSSDDQLYLLVRRKSRYSHWDRARKILQAYGLEIYLGTRVHVMQGDVTSPNFGLGPEDLKILNSTITDFFHIAALTALNGSEDDCWRINVEGTKEALRLVLSRQGKTHATEGSLNNHWGLFIFFVTRPGKITS